MTDINRLKDPAAAIKGLKPGTAVILRHPNTIKRKKLAEKLRPLCRRHRLALLIAGDAKLAWRIRAEGVHLSETAAKKGRRALWPRQKSWLVTAAAHSEAAVHHARRAGANACLLSPVFKTKSHPGCQTLGNLGFSHLCHRHILPLYALGGLTGLEGQRLLRSGAQGYAGISGFLRPRTERKPQRER